MELKSSSLSSSPSLFPSHNASSSSSSNIMDIIFPRSLVQWYRCRLVFGRYFFRNSTRTCIIPVKKFMGFLGASRLGHDRFFKNPFTFATHQSSYHSAVYILQNDRSDDNPKKETMYIAGSSICSQVFLSLCVLRIYVPLLLQAGSKAHVPSISEDTSALPASYYLPQVAVDCFRFGSCLFTLLHLIVSGISLMSPQFGFPRLYSEFSTFAAIQ